MCTRVPTCMRVSLRTDVHARALSCVPTCYSSINVNAHIKRTIDHTHVRQRPYVCVPTCMRVSLRTDVHARVLACVLTCMFVVCIRVHVLARPAITTVFHGERSTPLPRGVASRAHGRTSKQSKRVHRIQTHGQVHARYRQIAGSSPQRGPLSRARKDEPTKQRVL